MAHGAWPLLSAAEGKSPTTDPVRAVGRRHQRDCAGRSAASCAGRDINLWFAAPPEKGNCARIGGTKLVVTHGAGEAALGS